MIYKRYFLAIPTFMFAAICNAQDSLVHNTLTDEPAKQNLIPDKVFDFGIPMLFLIVLLNIIVTVLKNRADHQLKLKMIEKGIPDETLIQIFKDSNTVLKLQPIKYFLLFLSLGISFFIIHFTYEERDTSLNQSGYYSLGVILLLTSIAFIIYYKILQKKL